jgi:peptide deformylase
MAVLDILVYPDPRLKQISKPVVEFDDSLRSFVLDLEETLRAGPGGVGIAAPQVGHFERIVIVDVSCKPKIKHHGRLVLINPEIVSKEGSAVGREGCLSVPEYTGNVARAKFITLQAQDELGQSHEYPMERYEARAVQHEMDHLDGLLLLDRLVSRRDLFRRQTQEAASPKSETS